MNSTYQPPETIEECDRRLAILRDGLNDSAKNKRARWMNLINDQLDERLKLMKLRDAENQWQNQLPQ